MVESPLFEVTRKSGKRIHLALLALGIVSLVVSAYHPADAFTWVLEVFPAILGAAVMIATYSRFRLTTLLYTLILIHALILMLGGHYTYAQVPFGFWMQDWFGFTRNHYDRIGHFAQGFIPAMLTREILLRKTPLKSGGWLFFLVTCVCMAISAFYEFIEWWTALASGEAAMAFLGTQGDVWDTQWDMFLAFVGAITAQLTLSRIHDRQIAQLRA